MTQCRVTSGMNAYQTLPQRATDLNPSLVYDVVDWSFWVTMGKRSLGLVFVKRLVSSFQALPRSLLIPVDVGSRKGG